MINKRRTPAMKQLEKFPRAFAAAMLFVCMLFVWSCQSPQRAAKLAASPETVFVVFEGPWAFVTEPSGEILAIAPKATNHTDAYAKAEESTLLPLGKYQLSVLNRVTKTQTFPQPTFLPDKVSSATLTGVVNNSTGAGRYMIILPQPDGLTEAEHSKSQINYPWPVDPKTPIVPYSVSISLQYTVSTLDGFKLTGTPDDSSVTFSDFPFAVGVPRVIHIAIDPLPSPKPDPCDDDTKLAFKELMALFSLQHIIDFQPYPSGMNCQTEDPQNPQHPPVAPSARAVVQQLKEMETLIKNNGKGKDDKTVLMELQGLQSSAAGTSPPLASGIILKQLLDVQQYLKTLTVKDSDTPKLHQLLESLSGIIDESRHRTGADCKAAMVMLTVA
jgi:hypothetical protein